MKELISVIIPIYNKEKYIERCINSILAQTYKNIEIILVDDGSSDNSFSICKKLKKEDFRIKLYHQENRGVSSARNTGIKNASGRYFAFIDSDDWIEPTMLEELINVLERNDCDISVCDFFEIPSEYHESIDVCVYDNKTAIRLMMEGKVFSGHLANKLFSRKIFEGVSLPENIMIYEDMLTVLKLMFNSRNIVYYHRALYHYPMNVDSAMHQPYKDSYFTAHFAGLEMLTFAKEKKIEPVSLFISKLMTIDLNLACKMAKNSRLDKISYQTLRKVYLHNPIYTLKKMLRNKMVIAFLLNRKFFISCVNRFFK